MATIGLDKLYYATITDQSGTITYGSPTPLAKAISANITIESSEAILYADDTIAENIREFNGGTISLNIDDLSDENTAALLGATVNDDGVLIFADRDRPAPVAVGFRAKKANGKYRYFWLYKVLFKTPNDEMQTKGESINFATPTIEGKIMRGDIADAEGKYPWKAEANEGDASLPATVISGWFTEVYEPDFTAPSANLSALTLGSLTLSPAFNANTTAYTTETTNATNTVTATAADAGATIAITVGDTTVVNGQAATWAEGANTLSVVVTNGSQTKTYTVTVTKS